MQDPSNRPQLKVYVDRSTVTPRPRCLVFSGGRIIFAAEHHLGQVRARAEIQATFGEVPDFGPLAEATGEACLKAILGPIGERS